jgi:hypothetical protein
MTRRMEIALPLPEGSNPLPDKKRALEDREWTRTWIAEVSRDGYPTYAVAGDARKEVVARIPARRPGPNGPIDAVRWLRQG